MSLLASVLLLSTWPLCLVDPAPANPRPACQEADTEGVVTGATLAELEARLQEVRRAREAGDHAGARERVVPAIEGALALDASGRGAPMTNLLRDLGGLAYELGALREAEAAQRAVLRACERTLPEEDPTRQAALVDLGNTLVMLGQATEARALYEAVLVIRERTLPEEHGDIQSMRRNLANTLYMQGDLAGAHALCEAVVAVLERTLEPDDLELQMARGNLAGMRKATGDLAGARALEEAVLEVFERRLPEDHQYVIASRQNLAGTYKALGDLASARRLEERALAALERVVPDDHPHLQALRLNVARTLYLLGDLQGARVLQEAVLATSERTLPANHPEVQAARYQLSITLGDLGDLQSARRLQEAVLAVYETALPEDHPELQWARSGLASTLFHSGEHADARALQQQVLDVLERVLPPDHPDLARIRGNLAMTIALLGDLPAARTLQEQVLAAYDRTLPEDDPARQTALRNLTWTLAVVHARRALAGPSREGSPAEWERCRALVDELVACLVGWTRSATLSGSVREVEERCSSLRDHFDLVLALANGLGVLDSEPELVRQAFLLSEVTRGAGLAATGMMRVTAGSPSAVQARAELREASAALAGASRTGSTSEEYHASRARRERAERTLLAEARRLGTVAALDWTLEQLASALGEGQVAIGMRRAAPVSFTEDGPPPHVDAGPRLVGLYAFVLRGGSGTGEPDVQLVPLGPLHEIDAAVTRWRTSLGGAAGRGGRIGSRSGRDDERSRGEALRQLVWDPLLPAIGEADRVVVALDDVLHLVPLDALPLGEGEERVGDRWRIETRVALWELLQQPRPAQQGGGLVVLGDAAFDRLPADLAEEESSAPEPRVLAAGPAALLRDGPWEAGFPPLAFTLPEARGIAALFEEAHAGQEDAEALALLGHKASRHALEAAAPRARYLHVATHGWFAPKAFSSWSDIATSAGRSEATFPRPASEVVRGMSPMVLCGLALAGANLPEDALGRVPGLITAEELSTLDLSRCELAVLSACDTGVGERRAGQGVASLQKALQMAGARSVVTSLWKVPDEATAELMLEFYRRLWVEGESAADALWGAKRHLRDARHEDGTPRHRVQDWAGWVLTGAP